MPVITTFPVIEVPVVVVGPVPAAATVNVAPAITGDDERAEVVVFAGTVTVVEPVPVPDVGDKVTHESVLDADQLHPDAVVTVTAVLPPDLGYAADVGENRIHTTDSYAM